MLFRLLLDPDPEGLNGGGIAETAVESPAPEPVEEISDPGVFNPSEAGEPSPVAGTITPAPEAQAQAAADQWQSIRDAARSYGYSFDESIADDRAALVHLIQQAQDNRQADYYAQIGRQLAPHVDGIQGYLAQQQTPAAPATRPEWEAPEFDERWAGLVDRDPGTGLFVSKPGVPHEIASKVNTFVEWKAKFDRNPAGVLNSMVESRAQEIAKKVAQEEMANAARDQSIQQIVRSNSEWLYAKDQSGRPIVGANGQYVPSAAGARYMSHLQAVRGMGVTDPRAQDMLAKQLLQGEIAQAGQQSQSQAAAAAASPQTQQAVNRPPVNPLQAAPPVQRRANPAATEPSNVGMSLREMIAADFAAEGITDADFGNVGQ